MDRFLRAVGVVALIALSLVALNWVRPVAAQAQSQSVSPWRVAASRSAATADYRDFWVVRENTESGGVQVISCTTNECKVLRIKDAD